jgi:hypothetical protein
MFGVGTPANLHPLFAEYGRLDSSVSPIRTRQPLVRWKALRSADAEPHARSSRPSCTSTLYRPPAFITQISRPPGFPRTAVKAIDVRSGGLDSAALASTSLSPVGARRRSSTSDFHALPRANRTSSKRRKRNSYCASSHSSGHCSRKIVPTQKLRPALSASAFVSLSVRLQPGDVVESAEAG